MEESRCASGPVVRQEQPSALRMLVADCTRGSPWAGVSTPDPTKAFTCEMKSASLLHATRVLPRLSPASASRNLAISPVPCVGLRTPAVTSACKRPINDWMACAGVSTVTVNEQALLLPAASLTVQVTVVVPIWKVEPDGGVQLGVPTPGQLSETVGSE